MERSNQVLPARLQQGTIQLFTMHVFFTNCNVGNYAMPASFFTSLPVRGKGVGCIDDSQEIAFMRPPQGVEFSPDTNDPYSQQPCNDSNIYNDKINYMDTVGLAPFETCVHSPAPTLSKFPAYKQSIQAGLLSGWTYIKLPNDETTVPEQAHPFFKTIQDIQHFGPLKKRNPRCNGSSIDKAPVLWEDGSTGADHLFLTYQEQVFEVGKVYFITCL